MFFLLFLIVFVFLRSNLRPTLYKTKKTIEATTKRKATTSSNRYWYQVRLRAAERRCGAPLCLNAYSTQKTPFSKGFMGSSRIIACFSFTSSAYLRTKKNQVRCQKNNQNRLLGIRQKFSQRRTKIFVGEGVVGHGEPVPYARGLHHVPDLVGENGDAQNGDAVMDGLHRTQQAAVRYKQFDVRVS